MQHLGGKGSLGEAMCARGWYVIAAQHHMFVQLMLRRHEGVRSRSVGTSREAAQIHLCWGVLARGHGAWLSLHPAGQLPRRENGAFLGNHLWHFKTFH